MLGDFLDKLDTLAGTLAFEFNKIYSSGQGLKGYQSLTSQSSVDNVNARLDAAGLHFTPVNGQFDVQVFNRQTGLTQTTTIHVDLNGLDGDTTLTDLAAQLNGVNGISAIFLVQAGEEETCSAATISLGRTGRGTTREPEPVHRETEAPRTRHEKERFPERRGKPRINDCCSRQHADGGGKPQRGLRRRYR